ncbi:hypothetical protein GWK47_052826 [Chionoecetes opilio]|uniref:Tesmin/TSO1-like CXC domain-containing protein n=1 Tax=Chionoecetes opilio TaxID=41210 RepID=A0A8J4Y8K4_CHIOP|nr:hypothetical protein GWK47_052826 [Chionoecetes opilio]
MVLCLGMGPQDPIHLFQKCGTKNPGKIPGYHHTEPYTGGSVCDSLIGMHAFTGCDTVSAFAGRGKMTTLKQVKMDKTYQDAFHELGRSWKCLLNSLRNYRKSPATCCDLEESLQSQPFVANPTDCGWMTDEDGKLAVNWMRGSPHKMLLCSYCPRKCVRSCELPKCTCLSKGLKCTDMCRLQTCQNKAIEEEPVAQQSDSESDVDDIEEINWP